jgi:hypothetical protein
LTLNGFSNFTTSSMIRPMVPDSMLMMLRVCANADSIYYA